MRIRVVLDGQQSVTFNTLCDNFLEKVEEIISAPFYTLTDKSEVGNVCINRAKIIKIELVEI